MATFKQAHQSLIDYTARFNRFALELANQGISDVTVEHLDSIGAYPQVPYQWRRRMPDVMPIAPDTILKHRDHVDQSLSPTFCGAMIDANPRPYQCPVGYREYTGLTRQEIDGN